MVGDGGVVLGVIGEGSGTAVLLDGREVKLPPTLVLLTATD